MAIVIDHTAKHRGAEMVGLADQRNWRIVVFDTAYADWNDPAALVWSYTPEKTRFGAASGLKLRYSEYFGCEVALMCASGGYAAVVSYPEGKVLFETENTAENVHSIELTPHGFFAVASSTGEETRIFNTALGDSVYASVKTPEGHGLLWDPNLDCLWLLEMTRLRAFRVTKGEKGIPVLTEIPEYGCDIPEENTCGHDLSPVYGNPDRMWITARKVYQYDKKHRRMVQDYPETTRISRLCVKGMGNRESGMMVRVMPNGTMYDWNTDLVDLFIPVPGKEARHEVRHCPDCAFYKSVVWDPRYC